MEWHIDTHEMNPDEIMEILEVLEARGYTWKSGHKPTQVPELEAWVYIDYSDASGLMFYSWDGTQEDLDIGFESAVGPRLTIEEVPYV